MRASQVAMPCFDMRTAMARKEHLQARVYSETQAPPNPTLDTHGSIYLQRAAKAENLKGKEEIFAEGTCSILGDTATSEDCRLQASHHPTPGVESSRHLPYSQEKHRSTQR